MKSFILALSLSCALFAFFSQSSFAEEQTVTFTFIHEKTNKPVGPWVVFRESKQGDTGGYSVFPSSNGQATYTLGSRYSPDSVNIGNYFGCDACASTGRYKILGGRIFCETAKTIEFYEVTEDVIRAGGGSVIVPDACINWPKEY